MSNRPILSSFRAPAVLGLGVVVFQFATTAAYAQMGRLPLPHGTEIFKRLLHEANIVPITDPERLGTDPKKKMLIVFGRTQVLDQLPIKVEDFVGRGGALLVATDLRTDPSPGKGLSAFNVWVDGRKLLALRSDCYKALNDCPFIAFSEAGSAVFKAKPEEPGVATNLPSYLHLLRSRLNVIAQLPPHCRTGTTPFTRALPFAAGGDWGNGRILVLADHSIFINEMLWLSDTQNLDFADACLDWLAQNKRTEALFYDEGSLQSHFDVPLKDLPTPPLPPVEEMLKSINHGLVGIEEENRFNDVIANMLDRLSSRRITRLLVIALTVGLGIAALSQLSLRRYRTEGGRAHREPLAAEPAAATPVLQQRQNAISQNGNYYEPAHALARQFFDQALPPGEAGGEDLRPDLYAGGAWWERWRAGIRWRRLWQLAYDERPQRVSRRRLMALARDIDRLSGELARHQHAVRRASRIGDASAM
jgi:hypothetical protein